jgi:hypothetical protein
MIRKSPRRINLHRLVNVGKIRHSRMRLRGFQHRLKALFFAPARESSLLAASSGLIAITTIYLYFVGFLYCYFFFQCFGVDVASLDLPTQYYLMHSYSALSTEAGIVVFCSIVLALSAAVAARLTRWLILTILLVAFPILFWTGRSSAIHAAQDLRNHPDTPVRIILKEPEKSDAPIQGVQSGGEDEILSQLADNYQLYLLFQTKDKIIVYSHPQSDIIPPVILPSTVYTISLSDVKWSSVHIQ